MSPTSSPYIRLSVAFWSSLIAGWFPMFFGSDNTSPRRGAGALSPGLAVGFWSLPRSRVGGLPVGVGVEVEDVADSKETFDPDGFIGAGVFGVGVLVVVADVEAAAAGCSTFCCAGAGGVLEPAGTDGLLAFDSCGFDEDAGGVGAGGLGAGGFGAGGFGAGGFGAGGFGAGGLLATDGVDIPDLLLCDLIDCVHAAFRSARQWRSRVAAPRSASRLR